MDYSTYGNYGSYGGYGTETGALAALGGIMIVFWIIMMAVMVVSIIGQWKMFKKAGQEGWKSLIPVYNLYTLCKIVGVNPWWILIIFVGSLVNMIPIIGSLAYMAATVYFGILLCVSTAKSYGKGTGFAVGLYFLTPIFQCILGFGNSTYVGPCPMNDIIFKNNGTNNQNNNNAVNSNAPQQGTGTGFCTNCGAPISGDTAFCTSCGSKLN